MKRLGWLGKACALVALVGMAGGCVSQSKYDNLLDHNRRLTALLNEADAEKSRLQADLQQSQSSLDTTKKLAEGLDADNRALREAMERSKQLSSQLEKQLSGIPGVTIEEGKVSLTGEVFFDSGKATIKKTAEESLKKVAQALKQSGVVFRIDGHTDSQPIVRSGWKSNHDLAAARALAVFHFFGEEGIGEERMYVAAYGPNKPKTSNETAEGRKQNRRVEMLLLSGVAAATPPPGGAAPKAPKAKKPAGEEAPAPKKPKT